MKVLHINTSTTGGASLCAQRIMNATMQQGIESKLLVCKNDTCDDISIIEQDRSIWNMHSILNRIKNLLIKLNITHDEATLMYHINMRMEQNGLREYCHVPYSEYKSLADHPLIEWADVIHLHWVTGLIDYPTFFRKVRKPIVWTMHDKYPLAGLLHYVNHPVPDCLKDIDKECRKVKRQAIGELKNLHMVAISQLMMTLCKQSDVTEGLPVHLIHNGVDEHKFQIVEGNSIRQELNIMQDSKVILFSAYWIHDSNKGLDRIISALESLHRDDITLVCVGKYKEIPQTNIDIKCLGFISETNYLSRIYSMADYFILASFEETFAQTPVEALACGTPVISTPCSGAHDLINEANGVVCDDFTVDALRKGIETAMGRSYDSEAIRADVVKRFSYDKIGREYVELYEEVSPLHLSRKGECINTITKADFSPTDCTD